MDYVYGLNKSGRSIVNFLKRNRKEFRVWDDNIKVRKDYNKILKKDIFLKPLKKNLQKCKNIFVSPGISIRKNKFNQIKKNSIIKRDLNLYLDEIKNIISIAITGTNGKSTTTKLVGEILSNKNKTFIGGNIGKPLCDSLYKNSNYKYHVVELSSFQLETVKEVNSHISIITNLSIDHQDRYNSVFDYINQKKNILTKNGYNLISLDDKYSKKIFYKKDNFKKISFSVLDPSANFYMDKNKIFENYHNYNKSFSLKKISKDLHENYNKQNILIAYICTKLLNVHKKYFFQTINKFRGLPYRSKIILNTKKFLIINNSKSTNLNSSINSLTNYKNVYLILGGIAKEDGFETLSKYSSNLTCVYIYGKSAKKIDREIKNKLNTQTFKTLKLCLIQAVSDAKKNRIKSTILFAPACSSYDQFKDFEDRGKHFTNIIKKIIKAK